MASTSDGPRLRNGRTVAEICAAAGLEGDVLQLLEPGIAPRDFVARLKEREMWLPALDFLAHALPRREAVWWAWSTARDTAVDADERVVTSLEATRAWIAEPTDSHRRAAFDAAQAADFGTPAGAAGLAAFFCGDSLAPPDVEQAVPPGEFMAARAIAGSLALAGVATEPERAPEKYARFIDEGLAVAEKSGAWEGT